MWLHAIRLIALKCEVLNAIRHRKRVAIRHRKGAVKMIAVHFGAGNIGRGFIAPLLDQAGYKVYFVDVNGEIIRALNSRKFYTVRLADSKQETFDVTYQAGLNSIDNRESLIQVLTTANLVTTAVGATILDKVAPTIAEGLRARLEVTKDSLNIIACENMINGSSILKDYIWENLSEDEKAELEEIIGFPNSAIDRIVPHVNHEDPLFVEVEPFYEWVINASEIKGKQPSISGVTYVDELLPYIERKLFTVNTGHAACAYLGYYYGLATIKEAMDDPRVRPLVEGVLDETGQLLQKKYGFDVTEHQAYIKKILQRFENEYIIDETRRVGRSPLRKIGSQERFVKPATELLAHDITPKYLATAIVAATKYKNNDDPEAVELQEFLKEQTIVEALIKYSGIQPDSVLLELVKQAEEELK